MDSDLREVLMAPSILGSVGAAIYFVTKLMTDYSLKKKMIEKGFVNEDTQAVFKHSPDNKFGSLKWGLITLSIGIALILLEYIQTGPESPLPYGLLAVFLSVGFLSYYFIVKKGPEIITSRDPGRT